LLAVSVNAAAQGTACVAKLRGVERIRTSEEHVHRVATAAAVHDERALDLVAPAPTSPMLFDVS
jgi:hypothetical protein